MKVSNAPRVTLCFGNHLHLSDEKGKLESQTWIPEWMFVYSYCSFIKYLIDNFKYTIHKLNMEYNQSVYSFSSHTVNEAKNHVPLFHNCAKYSSTANREPINTSLVQMDSRL